MKKRSRRKRERSEQDKGRPPRETAQGVGPSSLDGELLPAVPCEMQQTKDGCSAEAKRRRRRGGDEPEGEARRMGRGGGDLVDLVAAARRAVCTRLDAAVPCLARLDAVQELEGERLPVAVEREEGGEEDRWAGCGERARSARPGGGSAAGVACARRRSGLCGAERSKRISDERDEPNLLPSSPRPLYSHHHQLLLPSRP